MSNINNIFYKINSLEWFKMEKNNINEGGYRIINNNYSINY